MSKDFDIVTILNPEVIEPVIDFYEPPTQPKQEPTFKLFDFSKLALGKEYVFSPYTTDSTTNISNNQYAPTTIGLASYTPSFTQFTIQPSSSSLATLLLPELPSFSSIATPQFPAFSTIATPQFPAFSTIMPTNTWPPICLPAHPSKKQKPM